MFSRILVPIDFSPASDAALQYARALADKFGSSLQLLHVIEEPTVSSDFVADGFAPGTDGIREALLAQARASLSRLVNATDRAHGLVRVDVVMGAPASAIVDYARATGAHLIVMGTHGRTGLAHLLMGSVAEHVVRTAPCAVLTARQVPVTESETVVFGAHQMPLPA